MNYEVYMGRTSFRDWGWDFEKREDIGGWDFSLFFGWFHITISRTSGM